MKKIVVIAAALVAAIGAWLTLVSTGVAGAAPDVSGQTFSEAQATLEENGYAAVMATSVGDRLAQGDCAVVRENTTMGSPFVGGDVNAPSSSPKVLLSLDCNPKPKSNLR